MSKYILGALATLIAIKGKDQFVPPNLTTPKEREDAMKGESKPAPVMTTTTTVVRQEPSLEPLSSAVSVGFGGKAAPPAAPQPEI
jgi:hypothetical protein